jgi:hypothetical protein
MQHTTASVVVKGCGEALERASEVPTVYIDASDHHAARIANLLNRVLLRHLGCRRVIYGTAGLRGEVKPVPADSRISGKVFYTNSSSINEYGCMI